MSRIISISTPKGGVGKTTTAVNLSAALSALDKSVLLIDMDPSGSCSISFGIENKNITGGVFNLLNFTKSIDQIKQKTFLKNLDIILFQELNHVDEERLIRLETNYVLLKNILQRVSYKYDFIILDCPPYLRGLTTMALTASNSVLIPVRTAGYSISALQKLVNHLIWVKGNTNYKIKIEGILQSSVETNTKVSLISEKELYRSFGKYLMLTKIPKSTLIPESTFKGKPALLLDAKSKISKIFLSLAREVIIRNKECPAIAEIQNVRIKRMLTVNNDDTLFDSIYPNPFNKKTKISFSLSSRLKVSVKVTNMFDRNIETLVDDFIHPGKYELEWNPFNLNPGIYNVQFEAGTYKEVINIQYN